METPFFKTSYKKEKMGTTLEVCSMYVQHSIVSFSKFKH
jgi:hypothetical protein